MHTTSKEVYEYISKQTNDRIVEWKTCEVSGVQFPIYQSDLAFYDKISPVINGVKYQIPTPKFCPEERKRRRMAWRNENIFYRRKCDATGSPMITIYSENNPSKVYHWKFWRSDQREALDYASEIDYSKAFFEQLKALNLKVPKPSLQILDSMENCDYCNYGYFSKDCYLCTGASWSEGCLYSTFPIRCSYDLDGCFNVSCEHTYQSLHCHNCYEVFFSDHSEYCKHSSHLAFCKNCEYCFGCVNLNYKHYHIFNKAYSKEQYEAFIKKIKENADFRNQVIAKYQELLLSSPRKALEESMGENNFSNYVQNGKNNILCSVVLEGNENKYSNFVGINEYPCFDIYAGNGNACLEACWVIGNHSAFVFQSGGIEHCYYSLYLTNCEHCFGCVGLKNKKYCIFNKQYTPEVYEQEVAKIITHMQKTGERGEFFPIADSLFGYNETVAQRYLPLTAQEAKNLNYPWQEEESLAILPQGVEAIPAESLSDNIEDIGEDILDKILLCKKTKRPYRITKQEFTFYKKHGIPLPQYHQDERKKMLLARGMGEVFELKNCWNCHKETLCVTHGGETRTIYCKVCYEKLF